MNNRFPVIPTGLYSDKAYRLLQFVIGNAQTLYNRDHGVLSDRFYCIGLRREADGEISFVVDENITKNNYWIDYPFTNDTTKSKQWFAHHMKRVVRKQIEYSEWDRNSDIVAVLEVGFDNLRKTLFSEFAEDVEPTLNVPVRDIYFIYDFLLSRKNLDKKYDRELIDSYVGQPRDPITTELYIAHEEEMERLKQSMEESVNLIINEKREEQSKLREKYDDDFDAITKKFDERKAQIRKEFQLKIDELDAKHESMLKHSA